MGVLVLPQAAKLRNAAIARIELRIYMPPGLVPTEWRPLYDGYMIHVKEKTTTSRTSCDAPIADESPHAASRPTPGRAAGVPWGVGAEAPRASCPAPPRDGAAWRQAPRLLRWSP